MYWVALTLLVIFVTLRVTRLFVIQDGFAGLYYRNGRLREVLRPGLWIRWGWRQSVVHEDLRMRQLDVAGQEVLTNDRVSVKMSLTATLRLADARRAHENVEDWSRHVYLALQLALRNAVSSRGFDAVLNERDQIGADVLAAVKASAEQVGVEILETRIRDVMMSADLRKAFAEAVQAREQGKAALERARGETAALRSLANTARMIREHPGLLDVRMIQSVENVGASNRATFVIGMPVGTTGVLGNRLDSDDTRDG